MTNILDTTDQITEMKDNKKVNDKVNTERHCLKKFEVGKKIISNLQPYAFVCSLKLC